MKYELKRSEDGKREYVLRDNEDGTFSHIPAKEENSDYQAYLRWLNGEEENGTIS